MIYYPDIWIEFFKKKKENEKTTHKNRKQLFLVWVWVCL